MTATRYIISVLGGTGAEGGGLAVRWARAGHRVIIGSRSPEKAAKVCAELNARAGVDSIQFMDNRSAARAAEIVVLTVPHGAQRTTVEEVRDALAGKILVDATVPLVPPKVSRVQLPAGGSAVAAIQELLGEQVRVVSAFQNVSAHHLKDLDHTMECDVLVCGNDAASREIVIGLAADIGLRGYHAGTISNSAAAEALTSLLIAINSRYKVPGAGIRITGVPEAASSAGQPTAISTGIDRSLLNTISRVIATRRSIRCYRQEPIPKELIDELLRCATNAPSAHNRQPWRFMVLHDGLSKSRLAEAMGTQLRADRLRDGDSIETVETDVARSFERIAHAPVVVLAAYTSADMDAYPDSRRQEAESLMAVQGTAMAVQNLLLAAHAAGLAACCLCAPLFCPDVVRNILDLPMDWQPQAIITVGYPASAGNPYTRRPLADVVRHVGEV